MELIGQSLVSAILLLYPICRIFRRAGLNPWLGLLVLVPIGGVAICAILLIVMQWNLNVDPQEN